MATTWADLKAKYPAAGAASSTAPGAMAAPATAPTTWEALSAKYKDYQPPPAAPVAPVKAPTVGGMLAGAAGGAAKEVGADLGDVALGAGKQVVRTLGGIGAGIEKGLDQTLGRVINAAKGKGLAPTGSGARAAAAVADPSLKPTNLAQEAGDVAASVGEFFLPGGAERKGAELATEAALKVPKALGLAGRALKVGEKAAKVVGAGAATGASTAVVGAAQGQDAGSAGLAGFLGGAAGKAIEAFGKGLATALQKSDFKLPPMQAVKAAKKAQSAAEFMTENRVLGSAKTKYAKLSKLTDSLEATLQSSLPSTIAVPKSSIIDEVNARVESLKSEDPAVYAQARRDADRAIKTLQSQGGKSLRGHISVGETLAGKRSYGQVAFKSSKVNDPRVVAEGAYAVEQAYQKALEDSFASAKATIKIPAAIRKFFGGKATADLGEFNRVYSNAISAKNLTFISEGRKDSSLVGRLFGLWAGESVGQAIAPGLPGKIVGGAVGEILSTKLLGVARNLGERAVGAAGAVPAVVKFGLGASSTPSPTPPQL